MAERKGKSVDLGDTFASKRHSLAHSLSSNAQFNASRRNTTAFGNEGVRKRKTLASIVPTEEKFQKLKHVRLAGFAFVARSKNWYARTFWIILILLAFAFLTYEVYRTISDFINNPIITTYVLKPQDQINFPKIFVCPVIPASAEFYRSDSQRTLALMNLLKSLENLGSNVTDQSLTKKGYANLLKTDQDGPQSGRNSSSLHDQISKMGFKVEDVFLKCRFYGNESEWEDIKCSDIVTPLFDHRYGKCFQIDVQRNQTEGGKGLSLLINSRSKSDSVNDTNLMKPYEGVYVSVDSAYQPASFDKNLVSNGAYTKTVLTLTHLTLQNLQSGALIQPCAEDDAAKLKILNTRFTLASCKFECVLSEVKNSCSCLISVDSSILTGDILNSTKFCSFEQYEKCVMGKVCVSDDSKSRIGVCQSQCLSPCDDYRYEMSSSSAPLNPPAFESRASKHNADVDELVLLDVAFSSLETMEFTQTNSMTFDFFVGNMGSQVTLWIGGCMLTLLPLPLSFIAFCFVACLLRLKRCFKKESEEYDG